MNYNLNDEKKKILALTKWEWKKLIIAILAIMTNSISTLSSPFLLAYTIDNYLKTKNFNWILLFSAILLLIYIIESAATYMQTRTMGEVWIKVLFNLRNKIFSKLQELPIAFFNQNKTWDLISRINSDTEKVNLFFSQALTQFIWNISLMTWTWIFILALNFKLWIVTLLPALLVVIITRLLSWWLKKRNLENLRSLWAMSSEIQESLNNFKVMAAYSRLDYFRDKFKKFNDRNYEASVKAWIANNIFIPIYWFASNLAQLLTLSFWIYLISDWSFTLWLLIWYQFYINYFYNALRQIAALWSSFQLALASLDRINEITSKKSDMLIIPQEIQETTNSIIEFKNVFFRYPDGTDVLKNVSISLEKWKTYAFVGPTWWWKTTTASLMARLYDPSDGKIILNGRDIRSYDNDERAKKIWFILQEPFLFTWNIRENILYWNDKYFNYSNEELLKELENKSLADLLSKFGKWLETETNSGISLGQKQIIAFIRAILKSPDLLILDEATANIDTITEQILEDILKKLPANTTKVIIAHRLNTIKNADSIFFVNSWIITPTWSMEHALDMLLHGKKGVN